MLPVTNSIPFLVQNSHKKLCWNRPTIFRWKTAPVSHYGFAVLHLMKNNQNPKAWTLQPSLATLLMKDKKPLTFIINRTAWRGNNKGMTEHKKGGGLRKGKSSNIERYREEYASLLMCDYFDNGCAHSDAKFHQWFHMSWAPLFGHILTDLVPHEPYLAQRYDVLGCWASFSPHQKFTAALQM